MKLALYSFAVHGTYRHRYFLFRRLVLLADVEVADHRDFAFKTEIWNSQTIAHNWRLIIFQSVHGSQAFSQLIEE